MRSLALILVCAVCTGCTVALGPGFYQPFRAVGVSATSIDPPHIRIQVRDTLENVGNRSLAYLDVALPRGPSFGTTNMTVSIGGKVVTARNTDVESGRAVRVSFDPEWQRGEERQIGFSYELDPEPEGRGVVAATPEGFYLAAPGVFPIWQTPLGPFAQGSLQANKEQLEVSVPADFRVLALGREQRSEHRGTSVVHRFELLGSNFPPYLIAGRYEERRVKTRQGGIVFWTRDRLDPGTAATAARHLSETASIYQQLFGPLAAHRPAIYVVETSAELAAIAEVSANISAASFPEGVLFDHRAVALGLASDAVLNLADYELARSWFGWQVRPRADAELLLGRGMALCASVLAAEARGGATLRRQEIAQLAGVYGRAGSEGEEKAGFGPAEVYTRDQLRAKSYKAALFLISLEDIAGKERFDRAVRRILRDMAGQEIGRDELRSAFEAETNQNLAGVFRAWLDQPGIPADFRARYAVPQ